MFDRWGRETAAALRSDLEEDPFVVRWNEGATRQAAATKVIDRHVPVALYLDYVENAIELYVRGRAVGDAEYIEFTDDPYVTSTTYLNDLFATRRIGYRFDESGKAEWHGDEGVYRDVVRPALDALDDSRLAGCRQEFEAALGHLRSGTPKDHEDAIEEAGKAVESALKVVLDTRSIPRSGQGNRGEALAVDPRRECRRDADPPRDRLDGRPPERVGWARPRRRDPRYP